MDLTVSQCCGVKIKAKVSFVRDVDALDWPGDYVSRLQVSAAFVGRKDYSYFNKQGQRVERVGKVLMMGIIESIRGRKQP